MWASRMRDTARSWFRYYRSSPRFLQVAGRLAAGKRAGRPGTPGLFFGAYFFCLLTMRVFETMVMFLPLCLMR